MADAGAPDRPWFRHYDAGVPRTLPYPEFAVTRFLQDSAARFPRLPHVQFLGATYRYGESWRIARRFAGALQALGVRKGTRVALFLPNCPQMVFCYFGALLAGAVVVPTNPLYVERELEHQMKDSGCEVIVTLSKFFPTVQAVRPRTGLRHVIVTSIKDYLPAVTRLLFTLVKEKKEGHRVTLPRDGATHRLQDLLSRAPDAPAPVPVSGADLCLLQYTGGTTGLSKGAMLTHRNLVCNVLQCQAWLGDLKEGEEAFLSVIPFFHVFGMTVCMLTATSIVARLILLPRFETPDVLRAIDKLRPTIFPGVPRMYSALNDHPRTPRHDLKSVRNCISGAAPLPLEVARRFEALTGGKLVEGYGLTEAAPVTHANPLNGRRKEGSIGLPFPDVDVRLMDIETGEKEVPPGEPGEMCIAGPQVMQGYWNQPDETRNAIRGKWLYTGDIARRDEDGYFFIVDRKKEMVLVGGFNVYPREVEEVLFTHPKVSDCAVAGIPDAAAGTEIVKAYVILRPGQSATESELIEFCRKNLTAYKVPRKVAFRESLPKTLIGKTLRRVLVEEERQAAR